MKKLLFILLICIKPLCAQDHVGNSTGAWVCRDKNNKLLWSETVDVFEAIHEHKYTLKEFKDENEGNIVEQLQNKFVDIYLKEIGIDFIEFFENEIKSINLFKDSDKVVSTNNPLAKINDIFARLLPEKSSCPTPIKEPESVINYKWDGKLLKQNQLYADFSPRSKAATVIHEALYSALRHFYKETNSINTRKLVALLVSNKSDKELKEQFDIIFKKIRLSKTQRVKKFPARFSSRDKSPSLHEFESVVEFAKFSIQTASLYYNVKDQILSASWGKKTMTEASDEAKANCPGDCDELWTGVLTDCIAAYVNTKNHRYTYGELGPTRSTAEKWAKESCETNMPAHKDEPKGECAFLTSLCQDKE